MAGKNRSTSLPWILIGGILLSAAAGCAEGDGYSTKRPQIRTERYGVVTNPQDLAQPASAPTTGTTGTSGPSSVATTPKPTPGTPAAGGTPPGVEGGSRSDVAPPAAARPGAPPPPEAPAPAGDSGPPPGYQRERATVGATGKGNYRPGILTTPLSVYWRAQERIIFENQIPHAMNLYHATHGRYPRSQEEFEREILQANGIRLPTLPPGHRYVYDPNSAQLMVEKPQ